MQLDSCPPVENLNDQRRDVFAVYIAAASDAASAARVRAAIAVLYAHRFVITCTWPEVVAATPGGANPRDASDIERRGWSAQDLLEVDAAHAVWFLVPEMPTTTRGAWFEAGYAYAEKKHVVFSGDTKQSVFCSLGTECISDEAAIRYLLAAREAHDAQWIEAGLRELAENAPEPIEQRFDVGGEG